VRLSCDYNMQASGPQMKMKDAEMNDDTSVDTVIYAKLLYLLQPRYHNAHGVVSVSTKAPTRGGKGAKGQKWSFGIATVVASRV